MIGVIGATGMVGAAVAERLHSAGLPILLGGRRRSSINHPTHADIEITQVDITDSVSLDAFCRSCSIVVNCAGPSYRILDTVARTALSNGAHYVDPAGDDPVYTRLERPPGPQKAAVVSAGLLPGVSAMLLSWLADRLDEPVHRLSCLAGGIAPLSVAAAADLPTGPTINAGLRLYAQSDKSICRSSPAAYRHFRTCRLNSSASVTDTGYRRHDGSTSSPPVRPNRSSPRSDPYPIPASTTPSPSCEAPSHTTCWARLRITES